MTGNASGSYTCNRAKAKKYVDDNKELVIEMAEEFGCKDQVMNWWYSNNYEAIDCSIRCYLLNQAIDEIIEDENIEDNKRITRGIIMNAIQCEKITRKMLIAANKENDLTAQTIRSFLITCVYTTQLLEIQAIELLEEFINKGRLSLNKYKL